MTLCARKLVQTERIEREIQLARQIQETFLPDSMPQIPAGSWTCAGKPRAKIGGDFYDMFKLEENRLGW
jgi:phosphoserine phosphatase RsbU/P